MEYNNLHSCDYSTQYRTAEATDLAFAPCANLSSPCSDRASFQVAAPTTTTDRTCQLITNCTLGSTFQIFPPTATTDRACENSTVCVLHETYETRAPTLTSNRDCAAVGRCVSGEFKAAESTLTTNVRCQQLTECNVGETYQSVSPTPTTNRVCGNKVTACLPGQTFQTAVPTPTSNRVCSAVATCQNGSQYQSFPPTLTSNRICAPCSACPTNVTVLLSACTATSDARCATIANVSGPVTTVDNSAHNLSTGATAGIAVGCIILLGLTGCGFLALGRRLESKSRDRIEEAEMQVIVAQQSSAESDALVQRMRGAWQITSSHIKLLERLAEGAFGTVWRGLWGSQTVAVKVLKQSLDESTPELAEEFHKECEMLQSIRHPALIIFLGAGIWNDGKAFLVTEFMWGGTLRGALLDTSRSMEWALRHSIAQQVKAPELV